MKEALQLFERYHDSLLGGHLGIFKTRNMLTSKYYWPGMTKDIANWVARCLTCLKEGKELNLDTTLKSIKVNFGIRHIIVYHYPLLFLRYKEALIFKRVQCIQVAQHSAAITSNAPLHWLGIFLQLYSCIVFHNPFLSLFLFVCFFFLSFSSVFKSGPYILCL
ncbi:unnamed protein product [Lepidochelys olivacea]